MIQEAYCSFEIAKLLKEKGFDEGCRSYFINDLGDYRRCAVEITDKDCTIEQTLRPTHQMTMAWLREKGIECVVIPIWNTIGKQYRSYVLSDLGDKYGDNYDSYSDNISYEEAVEAALKYSLENLI